MRICIMNDTGIFIVIINQVISWNEIGDFFKGHSLLLNDNTVYRL